MRTEPTVPFASLLTVEFFKLRRSLALLLAAVAPALISVFIFFNVMRMETPIAASMMLKSSAAIWAFFMLPMSVTALTALLGNMEHGSRSWDGLHALPLKRWQLQAAKLIGVLSLVAAMSVALVLLTPIAIWCASQLNPDGAPTGDLEYGHYLWLMLRIFLASWLLIGVQLWIAMRFASFVPALATGIGGTFFAVVATSAKIGAVLPWQIPINQLASSTSRADLALALGCLGGCVLLALALRDLSRLEWN